MIRPKNQQKTRHASVPEYIPLYLHLVRDNSNWDYKEWTALRAWQVLFRTEQILYCFILTWRVSILFPYLFSKRLHSDFFFFNFVYSFILLLPVLHLCHCKDFSLVAMSRGYALLWCLGFSLLWLLPLQSTGSRHVGLSICST